ncbi:hypothetical protein [Bacillus altitudinis]|uniref:hypothetical protein n=1 Tax=Bacillus altitudinis TaxID=293387 RepID=UPI0022827DB1|nr:hypothetical protein [Bacillus altitudinis]MCY7439380.1 hypothetical protein [Bacillus altitudinis]MEC1142418.1 hypothetical protein [Bacillus altitudinis]
MTQPIYKTEKRKARVGERILITDDAYALGLYEKGTVLTVSSIDAKGVKSGEGEFILHVEYEVIVGEQSPAPNLDEMDYDELIALVEDAMKALRTRHFQGRFDAQMESVAKLTHEKSDQQKRDEIVARAKEDVEYLVRRCSTARTEFIVNTEKRTVVSIRKVLSNGRVISKGITKCAPDDCFNAHIGKAIALRRALGFEVPSEYLNAPQPEEVRVGDVVEFAETTGRKLKTTVHRIENGRLSSNEPFMDFYLAHARRVGNIATEPKIIDDSRAGGDE